MTATEHKRALRAAGLCVDCKRYSKTRRCRECDITRMQKRNQRHGYKSHYALAFTVIEMLVVVALVTIIASLIVGGVSMYHSSSVRSGIITQRRYHAPSSTYHGGDHPHTSYNPARWTITIHGPNKNGEMRDRTMDVPESLWMKAEIGQEVSASEFGK